VTGFFVVESIVGRLVPELTTQEQVGTIIFISHDSWTELYNRSPSYKLQRPAYCINVDSVRIKELQRGTCWEMCIGLIAESQVKLLWDGASASFKSSLVTALEGLQSAPIMVLLKVWAPVRDYFLWCLPTRLFMVLISWKHCQTAGNWPNVVNFESEKSCLVCIVVSFLCLITQDFVVLMCDALGSCKYSTKALEVGCEDILNQYLLWSGQRFKI
jgi:hypothetical protein